MELNNIKNILKKISEESGNEFVDLSTRFPVLISELNFSNSTTAPEDNPKIRQFELIHQDLLNAVSQQQTLQKMNRDFLDELQEKNNRLFKSFSDRMSFLNKMDEIIQKIKEESREMEIISLNTMVVSIKSGKQGQAFSYITSNLKQLSQQLMTHSENLITHEKSVRQSIDEIKTVIDSVSDISLIPPDKESGVAVAQTVESIIQSLQEMLNLAISVKHPIIKAMECVQMQDIIRQSLDDVILTIDKISETTSESDVEAQIDQYAFNKKLAELSVQLLDSIKEKLLLCTTIFSKNQTDVQSILEEVETKRKAFFPSDVSKQSSFRACEENIEKTVAEITELMNAVLVHQNAQNRVIQLSQQIQDKVLKMQACFSEFFPIIESLQYVAISQRIEVARNETISSVKSTVDYMTELIEQTNANVEESQTQLEQFIKASAAEAAQFEAETERNKKQFAEMTTEKNRLLENFTQLRDCFLQALSSFTVYSDDFFVQYAAIAADIKRVEGLSTDITRAKKMLGDVQSHAGMMESTLLKRQGLSSWEIHNGKFSEFIRHFTIVSDKETAGAIGNFEVEGGVESGEITFF